MNSSPELNELAAEWRNARLLYPVYLALAREFVIEVPDCADLEAGSDGPSEEGMQQARQWFQSMDERIQVHQLRQFLQTTALTDNESLRALLLRHLGKQPRTAADRDKIDFLLVQFFSHATPSRLEDNDCDLEYVAQVLEPVLGAVELKAPDWLSPLEQIIQSANGCHRLSELFNARLLEQGRKLKVQSGEKYFLPVAMVGFTRFSFLMRRVFFRLMHGDLNSILDGLRELENRGVTTLDCRRAHFSHQEPTDRLRMICHSWKVMFHAEYSSGQPLKMLADLRTVVEEVLTRSEGGKALGAAAGASGGSAEGQPEASAKSRPAAKFSPNTSTAPEFDIAAGQPSHGDNEIL
ncbi:MAG: hypothetical protein DMG68_15400 [Acidobacteria bacterium]|nr:MAG: hypothetical protein DMG68_15400 [Acidobacteriota bacterium]